MENPWASRKRRWAASPSTSSSTHRMVFGRGIGLSYGDWRTRATQDLFRNVLCVLLVRFSSIGDILLTTPLVRALARRHPEAKLVYVTKRAMAPLVADNPRLTDVVTLEPGEPIRHLARRLRALAPTPGAAHATKRWPVAHWSALAERLGTAGYRPVVVGGPDDRGLAQQLVAEGGGGNPIVSAAGEFSLQETGALLARARVVVSGDTGVMHMATGVGTPVVALFGPTVAQFGFFPYRAPAAVLERGLECRPCSSTGTAACPLGHHRCLTDITPEEVAATVERLVA